MGEGGRTFAEQYRHLLGKTMKFGAVERNARTGHEVRVLPGGASLKFEADRLPVPGVRRVYPRSAAVEAAWFLMGTRDPTWINERAPHWRNFVDATGKIEGAYGWRLRGEFGRDQVAMALDALRENPSDRQVYLSMWDPRRDGLGSSWQPKNVPCPTGFALNVVGGSLHMSLFMRSSDLFVGLPYDAMCFALLLDAFAADLGVPCGTVHVTLAHAHVYDSHWEMAEHSLSQHPRPPDGRPAMPRWSVASIAHDPDAYVFLVRGLAAEVPWPAYAPLPEIVP